MAYKVGLATACGGKKNQGVWPAWRLYKSPRIAAVHNRAAELQMFILSAEYGLVGADEPVKDYERVMDDERARCLATQVSERMTGFDWFVFFKAGARSSYGDCMKMASRMSGMPIALVGFGFMGEISQCFQIAHELQQQGRIITVAKSLEVYGRAKGANSR